LHLLLRRWCWQMPAPPHSMHVLLMRWCWQMLAPRHSLHWLLSRWCWQMLAPPHSLHLLLRRWCGQRFNSAVLASSEAGIARAPSPRFCCFRAHGASSAAAAAGRFLASALPFLVLARAHVASCAAAAAGRFLASALPFLVLACAPCLPSSSFCKLSFNSHVKVAAPLIAAAISSSGSETYSQPAAELAIASCCASVVQCAPLRPTVVLLGEVGPGRACAERALFSKKKILSREKFMSIC